MQMPSSLLSESQDMGAKRVKSTLVPHSGIDEAAQTHQIAGR